MGSAERASYSEHLRRLSFRRSASGRDLQHPLGNGARAQDDQLAFASVATPSCVRVAICSTAGWWTNIRVPLPDKLYRKARSCVRLGAQPADRRSPDANRTELPTLCRKSLRRPRCLDIAAIACGRGSFISALATSTGRIRPCTWTNSLPQGTTTTGAGRDRCARCRPPHG